MSFRRTPSGISNQHLFLGVEAMVFVEGGESLSVDDVLSGSFGSQSIDILFWQTMFSRFLPGRKFGFRAVGSKATLVSIAKEVVAGGIHNAYVAMDRDYDNVKECLMIARGVLYTFGYSWENDVWIAKVVEEIFYAICPVCRSATEVAETIRSSFDGFVKDMRWAVYADVLLSQSDRSLLPRGKAESVLVIDRAKKPSVNRARIRSLMEAAKSERTGKMSLRQVCRWRLSATVTELSSRASAIDYLSTC